jgi:hypothetical protein
MWLEEALPAFAELLELERLEGTAAAQERLETYRQAYLGLREMGAGLAPLAAPSSALSGLGASRLRAPSWSAASAEPSEASRAECSEPSREAPIGGEAIAALRARGVWVLWMLRRGLGELAFQELQQDPSALASTDRLLEAIRRRVGGDFDPFFEFWVYGTDLPAYRLEAAFGRPVSRTTGGGYAVTLRVANEGAGAFPAPAVVRTEEGARHEFRVSVPGGETREVTYPVLTRPVAAAIDPEGELLQSRAKSSEEWRAVRLRRWWIF